MKRSYKIIPIYTADVSGVCSALYELGGMIVMHDPSGCNSTYNTHDEIRWYDQDSMIYISGLTEIDAVMGNDEKLIRDIEIVAEELKPKFIALAGSPIPYMNGTDFEAIAKILEQDLGIPAFSVPTNGMHDYVYGVGRALAEIAKRIEGKREVTPKSVNLLGVTPLDFGPQEHVDALIQNVEQAGWKVLSTWAMGDTLEDLGRAPEAEVNLVVSSTGLRAAEILQERFGTPYVTGTPIRGFMKTLLNAMEEKKQIAYLEKGRHIGLTGNESEKSSENQIILIGEPVIMESLAAVIETEYQISVRVICPLREKKGLLADGDIAVCGEEELEQALQSLKNVKGVVADPLYRPVCPENVAFYELPHIAFSGRTYIGGKSRKETEMGHLYFARHGQTVWNVENKICGATDIELTELGHQQAEELGQAILEQGIQIDEILYSPLIRAKETARHVSEVTGIPMREEMRLKEQNFGKYEGTPRNGEEFQKAKANFINSYEGGESMLKLCHRIYDLLDDIKKESDQKTYLLVAHNGISRAIQSYFGDMTNDEFARFGIRNCEIRKFEYKE